MDGFEKWFNDNGYYHDTISERKELMAIAYQAATAAAEANYAVIIEKATALCDQMARDGYQNAKLEAVRKLREALVAVVRG